ncbi:MAG: SDR family oxidoreductase [Candidatus Tectomicrobia bacterium]|nr:SDR family oxidoreductase [Candidatus Tectomicrobia bacterium]
MDLGLQGRVAVIGGASRGLGRACAMGLAEEGARVAVSSRSAGPLRETAEEIRSATGTEVLAVPGDLSRLADIRNLIRSTVDHFGRLDIVVSNSGGPPEGRAADTSEEDWARAIEMALQFFIRMSREALPHLRERSWGRIINILASTVYQPIDNLATSGVTRLGAVAYAKSLADEAGKDNVLVNNVAPGFLLTDRMTELFSTRARETGVDLDAVLRARASTIPLGRFGQPEELANLVTFLASEKNSYITGTTILVDGGVVRSVI